jgi:hypothetical protein
MLILEVVFLEIITFVLYFIILPADIYGIVVSDYLFDLVGDYLYQIMPLWLIFILILVLNILWIVLIKKWKGMKNVHVKLFIIWLVLVISMYVQCILIALQILTVFSGTKYLTC